MCTKEGVVSHTNNKTNAACVNKSASMNEQSFQFKEIYNQRPAVITNYAGTISF